MKLEKIFTSKYLSFFKKIYSDGSEYFVTSRNPNYNGTASEVSAVTMLVVNKTFDKMLLINEFRYPIEDYVIASPAGLIDKGETPEEAAVRELLEETGYNKVLYTKVLPATFSSVGMTDERVHPVLLVIDEDSQLEQNLGETEKINSYWVNKKEALNIALTSDKLTARTQFKLLLFNKGLEDLCQN